MSDPYSQFVAGGLGKKLVNQLGLPAPVQLRRFDPNGPLCDQPVAIFGAGEYAEAVRELTVQRGLTQAGLEESEEKLGAIVIDMSEARHPSELIALRDFGSPTVKRLARNARVVFIGANPDQFDNPVEVATQRALEGVVRSLGKELRAGATANLVYAPASGASVAVSQAVEFFLSGRSAFVDGQVVRVNEATPIDNPSPALPLQGKVAVVTGAARGIGAAIVTTLARDGATVVGVDVAAAQDSLAKVVNAAKGTALAVDVTDPKAADQILEHCRSRYGSLDIVVHNAGITRDKLFVNMDADRWNSVMNVNLLAILQMNERFLAEDGLGDNARIVCLSSQSGFAGNRGQTNYSATKAGIIGMVAAEAPRIAERGITINAVAPGLIETEMTAKMPFATREMARRINSLQQGGQPVDVADTIAWLAQPASAAVTGQTVRVCGQNMIGA